MPSWAVCLCGIGMYLEHYRLQTWLFIKTLMSVCSQILLNWIGRGKWWNGWRENCRRKRKVLVNFLLRREGISLLKITKLLTPFNDFAPKILSVRSFCHLNLPCLAPFWWLNSKISPGTLICNLRKKFISLVPKSNFNYTLIQYLLQIFEQTQRTNFWCDWNDILEDWYSIKRIR